MLPCRLGNSRDLTAAVLKIAGSVAQRQQRILRGFPWSLQEIAPGADLHHLPTLRHKSFPLIEQDGPREKTGYPVRTQQNPACALRECFFERLPDLLVQTAECDDHVSVWIIRRYAASAAVALHNALDSVFDDSSVAEG